MTETIEKSEATEDTTSATTPEIVEAGCCGGGACDEEPVSVRRPRVDAYTDEDRVVLLADVPGVDESGLDVTLEKDVLTIVGVAAWPAPSTFEHSHREFPRRRYERSFRLSDEVDRGAIEATVRNGVLRVVLPKTAEAKPTRIAVTAGA